MERISCGVGKNKPKQPGQKLQPEAAAIIDEVIHTWYLTPERMSVMTVFELMVHQIHEINKSRDASHRIRVPSRSTVYRFTRNLDPYMKISRRYGKRRADMQFLRAGLDHRSIKPLEAVEMDCTQLDIFVVDAATKLPIGKPWLITAVDLHSKKVVGIHVCLTPPNHAEVLKCLKNAILPKQYVKKKYPKVKHSWNMHGLPKILMVDKGEEFVSKEFEEACRQFGIRIQYAFPQLTYINSRVERCIASINRQLLDAQSTILNGNVLDKDSCYLNKNAVISKDALMEMLHIWIIDIHNQEVSNA